MRRVVTGHTEDGRAIVVSDGEVDRIPIGDSGTATALIWGRDDPGHFPDDGSQPSVSSIFPPPGGSSIALLELAPGSDEFHEFVSTMLAPWADPDTPGMHRTATMDYDLVLEGTVVLELDEGAEVILNAGDLVVQNGTRHRWHNRGTTIARMLTVTIGAHNEVGGGRPVGS
jgi:mannose-6-phosphate isomerase-like protein (cupin superfamily)